MSPPVAVFCRHSHLFGVAEGADSSESGLPGLGAAAGGAGSSAPGKRPPAIALLDGYWHQSGGGFRAGLDARPELYGQPGARSPRQIPSLRHGLNPCCHSMGSDGGCCWWLWHLAAEETLPRRPASRLGSRTGTGHPCSRYRCTLRELGSGWEDGGSGQERLN